MAAGRGRERTVRAHDADGSRLQRNELTLRTPSLKAHHAQVRTQRKPILHFTGKQLPNLGHHIVRIIGS